MIPPRTRGRARVRDLLDRQLLERARHGSCDALSELARRHADRVYRTAAGICRDQRQAERIACHVFTTAVLDREAWGTPTDVEAFLVAQSCQRADDEYRQTQHARGIEERSNEATESAPSASQRSAWSALDALATDERNVLLLARFGGLTVGEIAAELDISAATVKARMRAALNALRQTRTE